ncbi:hypothetical protein [Xanthomonas vesicatoria]|uniref:hypothetical protein n=1 Tax=Xanthomonas vesicatoria TaxID=56460 RepID=UPI001E2DC16C|nr:hypothetical protein [Xanthomonas vesicatoria]MCC8557480.1 hypothetical protein [Xanthomonas vesicatoria]MCC8595514.1 hypothetical protein [Xanthomonas vesicatoria]MCC8600491.1 hypothetical protein [Xanthomonas vesicatoria]MCC8604942.1 hypothetical protein [Xanthomonas vesicatoria]MCC8607971.1 hypothetical protein [Xanthomonas vesicatoria]
MNLKIRLTLAAGLFAISTLTACTGGKIRSDYKKKDVQPVKIEKAEGNAIRISYHMPAESLFYSPGVDFANDHGVLRIAIRRCSISDKCDTMAKVEFSKTEPSSPEVALPYAGEKVVLVYADTEETLTF